MNAKKVPQLFVARIAVLYQNDDYGKDYLKGLKDGLGDKLRRPRTPMTSPRRLSTRTLSR